jgi:hypothetical protein
MAIKKTETTNTLVILSKKLTKDQAKRIVEHSGSVMYPSNLHNKKMIAEAMGDILKSLRSAKK